MAKYALVPVSDEAVAAAGRTVSGDDPPGVLRDLVSAFYAEHAARWELQVQLCTDVETTPIEDAPVEWPEDASRYRPVAIIELPRQESSSPARRVYAEDVMSWRPWFGLTAHRPLGSINRVRRQVYEELGALRHERNARVEEDPSRLDQLPD